MNESEYQWKELLYTLFYEIKSEILGSKIEIEEEEYEENIKTITIPNLIKYIHDSIQILIIKKIEETKQQQKEEDEKFYTWKYNENKYKKNINISNDLKALYENNIQYMENKERKLMKKIFQDRLKIDAMENKISEYIDMEYEFEEMKAKFKYEDGRFLKNDRKDNEIIIIRNENSNLKKNISKLEQQIKKNNEILLAKDRLINNLKDEIKLLEKNQKKCEIKNNYNNSIKEQYNLLNGINININNGTNSKNSNKNKYSKHSNNNSSIHSNKHYNQINDESNISIKEKGNITERIRKINSSIKILRFSKNKKNKKNEIKKKDLLSTTRNDSFEKTKDDFIRKYFSGYATLKGTKKINNNNKIKISNLPINHNKINLINYSAFIPFVNSKRNLNNICSMKKIIGVGSINSSRTSSKKKKFPHNNGINYKSIN
jgi:hypothetical protein